jgi:hypothetical protein
MPGLLIKCDDKVSFVSLLLTCMMAGNMKVIINDSFLGVSSGCLQEYLNESCYRFTRMFWEPKLLLRLLNACLAHVPVRLDELYA